MCDDIISKMCDDIISKTLDESHNISVDKNETDVLKAHRNAVTRKLCNPASTVELRLWLSTRIIVKWIT